jgi:formimidoylglutamate deiminase
MNRQPATGVQQIIEADLTLIGERFERGVRIAVDDAGCISEVGALDVEPTVMLHGRAIIPGMINAHSHAFQRGLRGVGETFPAPPNDQGSFWSWREEMYQLVESMTAERIHALSLQAFREMRDAGITTVGEFHYLHHDHTGDGYAFDEIVLNAAAEAGIRIVLLNTYYHTGGIGQPLRGGQKRFGSTALDAFRRQIDRLSERGAKAARHEGRKAERHEGAADAHESKRSMPPSLWSLGIVAHSIRAVPIEHIIELQWEATRRHWPFHMHVEEQQGEIEECVHCYGKPPMALLNERLEINPMCTFVHCTHTATADLDEYLEAGGNVCICPLTEANLGDGLAHVARMLRDGRPGGHVCLGTDSNLRISMAEEMRWIEYGQRLAGRRRGVLRDAHGRLAETLWHMATTNGARSLGLKAGAIKPGMVADFATLDLDHPSLAGWTKDTLLTSFIFGCGNEPIASTCVGGHWRESGAA